MTGFPVPRGERPIITYDRPTALVREDAEFVTVDHPMVIRSIDLFCLRPGHDVVHGLEWTGRAGYFAGNQSMSRVRRPCHLNSDGFCCHPRASRHKPHREDSRNLFFRAASRALHKRASVVVSMRCARQRTRSFHAWFDISARCAHELSLPVITDAIKAMRTMPCENRPHAIFYLIETGYRPG